MAAAYESLLGRPLDIDGVRSYLNVIREGHDREFVIYALATSPEGLQFQSELDGLFQFLKLQRRLRRRPLSFFVKVVYGFRRQRLQANRLENMIGVLESRLSKLERAAAQPREAIVSTSAGPNQDHEADNLIKSPRAHDIFERLKSNETLKG